MRVNNAQCGFFGTTRPGKNSGFLGVDVRFGL
jgi:hypothetical protein